MIPEQIRTIRKLREPDEYGKRLTLQEIGSRYGVSREYIRQICGNSGRGIVRRELEKVKWELAWQVHRDRTITDREIAERYGLSESVVRKTVPRDHALEKATGTKFCEGCQLSKPLSEFYEFSHNPGCYMTFCRECNTVQHRAYIKKNRKRLSAYYRKYRRRRNGQQTI